MGRWANAPQLLDSLVDWVRDESRRSTASKDAERAPQQITMHRHRTRELVRALDESGFTRLKVEWQGRRAFFEDPDDFYDLQATFATQARKRLQEMTAEQRQDVRDRFLRICTSILDRGGRLSYLHAAMFQSARG